MHSSLESCFPKPVFCNFAFIVDVGITYNMHSFRANSTTVILIITCTQHEIEKLQIKVSELHETFIFHTNCFVS